MSTPFHLWLRYRVSRPVFDSEQLDKLETVVRQSLPQWSTGLRVTEDEMSKGGVLVGCDDRLYDSVHRFAPPQRGFASATLMGANRRIRFFMDHSQDARPYLLNGFTVETYGLTTIEGRPLWVWANDVSQAFLASLPVLHAHGELDEEFVAKNMIDDATGLRAVGGDLSRYLPGLYWLNYFGAPYVELIGRERLLSAPAYEVKSIGDGVYLRLSEGPEAWQTSDYRQREQECLQHIGTQNFFSRNDPDRPTVAPKFE